MSFVTKGFKVGIPPTNLAVISSSIDILLGGDNIGFVSQLNTNQTRGVDRVRHLDAADAGRIVEQVPLPEDATINATGFALYNKSSTQRQTLLNRMSATKDVNRDGALGGAFVSLNQQHIPIDLVRSWNHPMQGSSNGNVGDSSVQKVFYFDCYITSYSTPINIGTATIAETVTLQVGYVDSVVHTVLVPV